MGEKDWGWMLGFQGAIHTQPSICQLSGRLSALQDSRSLRNPSESAIVRASVCAKLFGRLWKDWGMEPGYWG